MAAQVERPAEAARGVQRYTRAAPVTNFYPNYRGEERTERIARIQPARFQEIIPRYNLSTAETRTQGTGPALYDLPSGWREQPEPSSLTGDRANERSAQRDAERAAATRVVERAAADRDLERAARNTGPQAANLPFALRTTRQVLAAYRSQASAENRATRSNRGGPAMPGRYLNVTV